MNEFPPAPDQPIKARRDRGDRSSRESQARVVSVTNTGAATATNGGIANTGFIESLTVVHQTDSVSWPVSIGRIPPLASAFQPRASTRELIDAARRDTADAVLTHSGDASPGDVLAGGGGVGKTQLGAWYASQAIRQGTELVVWVDAAFPGGIPAVFAEAGRRLRVPGAIGDGNAVEKDASAFRDWLQATHRTWFVVLDDIAEPQQAAEWWPLSHTGTGSTLATTRRRDEVLFAAGRRRVDVEEYSPDEGLDYLTQRITDAGRAHLLDTEAPALVKELGFLPLALSHAAAYVLSQRATTAEYLGLYRAAERRLDELMLGDPDSRASTTITITLLLALAASDGDEPDVSLRAAAMLASMLSPAGHPAALWDAQSVSRFLADADIVPGKPTQALSSLDRYSLVTIDEQPTIPTVRMHALTARAIREQLSKDEAWEAVRVVTSALLDIWPDREHEQPTVAAELRANAATIASIDAALGHPLWVDGGDGLRLARRATRSWISAGHYKDAILHTDRAISAATSIFGSDHSVTASARVIVIEAYRSAGQLDEATKVGEEVVASLLGTLGSDHAITLEALNSLAVAHRQAGNNPRAIELVEQASAGRDRLLGPDDPDALESRNNVAVAYWNVGRIAEAITLHERTLADRLRVLGPTHPGTMESRNNLAVAYWQDGRHAEAVALGQQVATDRVQLLGPDHPRTLESQHNLTSFYRDAGMNAEAVELGELTLEGHIRVMGASHHRTINSRHVLAVSYLEAGLIDKAIVEEEHAVADSLRVVGPDHRYTLAAQTNLSACYSRAGRTTEAVELAERVVAKHISSLGAQHPNTLRAQVMLAGCYRQAGRIAEAMAMGEKTVAECRRSLRHGHPQALAAMAELAEARKVFANSEDRLPGT